MEQNISPAMAANAPPELASGNHCCLAWQGKYIRMKKMRDEFKEAARLLQKAIADSDTKKSILEKKLEMVTARDTKEDDSAVKRSLEKKISDLKCEILSLQQRLKQNLQEKNEELKSFQDQASSREKEISELKDLLKKETLRADNSEEEMEKISKELSKTKPKALIVKEEEIKPHVPEASKELSLIKNLLASERKKTELERKKAESEKMKADQCFSELEVLRATSHKNSSDLTSNLETVKKQLEFEKQKTLKERKRADIESAKAREQMKLAESLSKKFETVRARNEELKKEMELQSANSKVKFAENSAKLEEKIRLLEINKKIAVESKSRADDLTQQLREAQLVTEGLKKQVYELTLSQKSIKTHSLSPHKVRDLEKAEMRLLKKELKFERNCAKHSKKVAKFEKFRREFQVEEHGRLKLEFGSIVNRMNIFDGYYSKDIEGTTGLGKAKGGKKQSHENCDSEENPNARCHLVGSFGSQEQARKFSAQLIPKSGRGMRESVSGTISQLESPTGGSGKLQSSGVISSATSFSDGQLMAQGREQISVTTSANIDKPIIQPTKSSLLQKISDTRKNGNLQSRQEVINDLSRKRKSMMEVVDSHKHLYSDDKKKKLQIGSKMGSIRSKVVGTGKKLLEEEGTLVSDRQGGSSANCITASKKRRVSRQAKTTIQNSLEFNQSGKSPGNTAKNKQVSEKIMRLSTGKGQDAATLLLEDVIATDCMKLLDLDNLEEESYYRMARESLLTPDLPQLDILGGEIVNEDNNPARALDLAVSKSKDLCETLISSETPSLDTRNDSVIVKMPTTSTALLGHTPEHFVVFSNIKDQHSIIKIFHAASNCLQRCTSVTKGQWSVPEILLSMKMEEKLLDQERVCVFLSLLLHNFSVVSSMKIGNTLNVDSFSCLDSFSKHIYDVMADIEAGGMLSEFSDELLSLLQNLLSEQRVLFLVKTLETSESDLSVPVTLNGENVNLISRNVLTDHLVAGSAIFAAMCTALGRVGFICEASFEILHNFRHENSSVLLTILHVFAYIAGEKMVSSIEHEISIAVLKSLVIYLENRHFGIVEGNAKLHPGKTQCPFSDKSSSLEVMASMLMGILQEFTESCTLQQSLTSSLGSSSHLDKIEFRPAQKDFQCQLSRDQSVTLCHLCDILSLVEIIASYTAWDWTCTNIVAPLLKMLGMPLPMNLSVAIVTLLGQLSSIGVDACGYESEGISNLREKLSTFLQSETTLKAGFAVQIATVSSLLKTFQLDFTTAFQDKTTMLPDPVDQSLSASGDLVRKWFSLLSDEQRVFTSEYFQTSVVR